MEDYLQEVGALTMRWVRRLSREKFSMVFTLFQPMVFWLIFFGNLFQRTANAEVVQAPSYIAFLAAGVVVMTILNNGLAGGTDLLFVLTITSLQVLGILGVADLFGVPPGTGLPGGVGVIL